MKTYTDMTNNPALTLEERAHYAGLADPDSLPALMEEACREKDARAHEAEAELEKWPDLYQPAKRARQAAEQAWHDANNTEGELALVKALQAAGDALSDLADELEKV